MPYARRIAAIREKMQKAEMDWLLLSPSTDFFYLTGIRERLLERLSCFLLSNESLYFVAPAFEIGNLPAHFREKAYCLGWTDGEDPFVYLARILPDKKRNAAIGGTMPAWMLLGFQALRPEYRWFSADEILREARSRKDEQEKVYLADVQRRSGLALTRLLSGGLQGMTEVQAAQQLARYHEEDGIGAPNGLPIVASGPNSALPHHHPGSRIIEKGDVVLIDFGGSDHISGYHADTTRTLAIGRAPEDLPQIYEIVRSANEAAFRAAKPDTPYEAVDRAARDLIGAAGYGEFFTHRIGHGLGLDIHEPPYISAGNTDTVQAGNVFSDEPGIYLPGKFGVRIEDLLYIGPEGAERLTLLDHGLKVID
jgi:Xaa-Pro aminopeptidase